MSRKRADDAIDPETVYFQPGDPPPGGYLAWHAWAAVQARAGLRQQQCEVCGLWKFPQERCKHEIGSDEPTTTTGGEG